MIQLHVVIPTYNRPDLLDKTLLSLDQARRPADLDVAVVVADNNSSPENQRRNAEVLARYPNLRGIYRLTKAQGRSHALNDAIESSDAEFIGCIDDDEKVDVAWLEVAAQHIRGGDIDYLGGPCLPDWESAPPAWLPIHAGKYKGSLGWIEQSDKMQPFEAFGGTLVGGNAVIRRATLLAAGCYSTRVGRGANNLMGGEDDELYRKLKLLGARGMYDPALIIFHFIPTARMTRKYHLRWAFWSGASNGVRLGWLPPEPVPMLWGLPRYRYGLAAAGLLTYLRSALASTPKDKGTGFAGLMDVCYFVGTLYGQRVLQAKFAAAAAAAA